MEEQNKKVADVEMNIKTKPKPVEIKKAESGTALSVVREQHKFLIS